MEVLQTSPLGHLGTAPSFFQYSEKLHACQGDAILETKLIFFEENEGQTQAKAF
jgi:hypothetical protein